VFFRRIRRSLHKIPAAFRIASLRIAERDISGREPALKMVSMDDDTTWKRDIGCNTSALCVRVRKPKLANCENE